KKIKVTYKVVSLPKELDEIKKKIERNVVESSNISVGGIQLLGEEELVPEQILRIELETEKKTDAIITFAEVRWCAKDNYINKYRIGIEFLVLKDEDRQIIEEIVGEA
ncbi:MAG: PilZ domain-containing protein, partial [Candidatus Goldbacteria bacterium]|nr:PilZ domain-containing protein [Candidatus Goldiibacteriota bacterium]